MFAFEICTEQINKTQNGTLTTKENSLILPDIYEAVNPNVIAIVARCVDRRFREAHASLIRKNLGLSPEQIWPIKQAGGVAALARSTQMADEFKTLTINIETGIEHSPNARHLILINHQDCRRYDSLAKRVPDENPERDDLFAAIRIISRKYPNLEVSGYFAFFVPGTEQKQIQFEAIGELCSLHKFIMAPMVSV